MMEGLTYTGTVLQWSHHVGEMTHCDLKTIRIDNRSQSDSLLYRTRILFENKQFYEGTLHNGFYHVTRADPN